jgi:type I restriction enzyme, R subunit
MRFSIKGNVTADWVRREAAQMRVLVVGERLLRKYCYPPDLQDAAVQKVLQQAGGVVDRLGNLS